MGLSTDSVDLDMVFSALADSTRRAILSRLLQGEACINELSEPFSMSQPAISKHVKVLEKAGLVERYVDKQRRPVKLNVQRLEYAVNWLNEFDAFWRGSFDQLDDLLNIMQFNDNGKNNE